MEEKTEMSARLRDHGDLKFFTYANEDNSGPERIKSLSEYFNDTPEWRRLPGLSPDERRGPAEEKPSTNSLDLLLISVSTAQGDEVLELIKEAIENPEVHVFGELLDTPNIKKLENGPHHVYWETLSLFAYGTYQRYLTEKEKYLELTPSQIKKLQLLTVVTWTTKTSFVPYSLLQRELDVENNRQVESLIIEAFNAGMIKGKLDQKNSQLVVDSAKHGRDVSPSDLRDLAEKLTNLDQNCEDLLACIEQQIIEANAEKQETAERKEELRQDILYVLKAFPPTSNPDEDGSPTGCSTS